MNKQNQNRRRPPNRRLQKQKKQPARTHRAGPRPLMTGKLSVTAGGRAFFVPEQGGRDLPVDPGGLAGALNGDSVRVRRAGREAAGRPRVEVVSVIRRAVTTVVGTYQGGKDGRIVPDDRRLPAFSVTVAEGRGHKAPRDGDKIVADILQYADGENVLAGRVTEVLGPGNDPRVMQKALIREKGLPDRFPLAALAAAKKTPQEVSAEDLAGREDLRGWCTVTIDGADAKDFDDAVSCTSLKGGGWLLGVHIADVAHYVQPGGALDREACRRGTSVYFPGMVLPMLPVELSNGICSLNEGVDRLTLSCLMEIDLTGRIRKHRLEETVIRSRRRLIYGDVNRALCGDPAAEKAMADVLPMLRLLREAAEQLRHLRTRRGAVDFDLPEPDILLDEKGNVTSLSRLERGEAERIIEDCMLAANETVAAHMCRGDYPYLYRVHEQPDGEKLSQTNAFLKTLGYGLRQKDLHEVQPGQIAAAIKRARGAAEADIVAKLLLRSMQKARYAETCLGHFGLACRYYCHFTSPIRRYPDLIGHRIIKDMLHRKLDRAQRERYAQRMPELARHCSERERAAVEAERAADDMACRQYLLRHVGEEFDGVISGVTGYGFFVELENTAEGLVRIQTLPGEQWVYEPEEYRIRSRGREGGSWRLGDPVRVRVDGGSVADGVELALAQQSLATARDVGYHKKIK